jgi:hypothetical protein
MSRSRSHSRTIAIALVSSLSLLVFAGPAAADTTTPGTYSAKATATALQLSVFGQSLTLGLAHAENASDPVATARGVGALVPGLGNVVEQVATANADGQTDQKPQACGPITLPPDFPALDLATACSAVNAAVTGGFPASDAAAAVATINVNANEVLGQATSQLNQPIGQLLDGLKPVFDALDQTGIDTTSLLNQIVSAITSQGDIVRITLGPSAAQTGAADASETASAAAQGANIQVLPRDALQLEPVLTILVGAATNTLHIDRNTGAATVDYEPSLVKVTIASDIATALGLSDAQRVVDIAPGVSQCLGLPAPLDSCITVAGGSQETTPEGITRANAAGVSLHLLTGVQDGIRLDLAATSVEGVGSLETARAEETPAAGPLARTGGSTPLALMALVMAIGFAGVTLTRRTRFLQ